MESRREFGKKILSAAAVGLLAGSALKPSRAFGEEGKKEEDKHACKGKGKDGKNECATAKHDCKGKNDCKSQGGCKTDANECNSKNACKGKGGCASPKKEKEKKTGE